MEWELHNLLWTPLTTTLKHVDYKFSRKPGQYLHQTDISYKNVPDIVILYIPGVSSVSPCA